MLGVRVFDVRLRCFKDVLRCHHGRAFVFSNFDDVMKAVHTHLKRYPSEFVLMHLQEDREAKDCSQSFDEIINKYLLKYPNIYYPSGSTVAMTLGNWRGKMSFIMNEASSINSHYITWEDFGAMQNDWGMTSKYDVKVNKPKAIVDFANFWFD